MATAAALWRRLDTPGHDACHLHQDSTGWRLEGKAVFRHDDGSPAALEYGVACDRRWHASQGYVRGWLGVKPVEFAIARTWEGMWALNGAVVPEVGSCIDIDFGFTPATNLIQLRRLALEVGRAADAPAAWFDVSARTLVLLPQRYERRSEPTYWYESPSAGYAELLEVAPNGFVRRYPGLWEMEF